MTSLTDITMMRQREIEASFLACAMVNPVETIQTCGWLSPDSISDEKMREVWRAIKERVGTLADVERATEISSMVALELAGPAALSWGYSAMTARPAPYAEEIAHRAYLTNLSIGIGPLIAAIQAGDDQKAREIVQNLASQERRGVVRLPDAIQVADKFAELVRSGNRSLPTYIPKLDLATGGFERKTLTILAARPSVGKTALGFQIARNQAMAGEVVWFFSLEMSAESLWARAACPLVGVTWRDVRAGKVSQEKQEELLAESYALAAQFSDRLIIDDGEQTTETIWRAVMQHRPNIVYVDHIRLCKDKHSNENKRQGIITQRLKEVSKAADVPVIALAQLNRQLENRAAGDKRPILADLRDSGEIEENADLVLMLHREMNENIMCELTECWLRKFRDGPRDAVVKMAFNPKKEWFE